MYALEDRELFELFLQHTPTAVAMVDREMRYLLASRQWLLDSGLDSQAAIGRSHYEIFPQLGTETLSEKGASEDSQAVNTSLFTVQPLGRWREIQASCLAGSVEKWNEVAKTASGGCLQVKWEARPWTAKTGEIGGLVLFAEPASDAVGASPSRRVTARQGRLSLPNIAEPKLESENAFEQHSQVLVKLSKSQTLKNGNLNAALKEIAETGAHTLNACRVSVWLYSNDRSRIKCIELYDRTARSHGRGIELPADRYIRYLQGLETERAIATADVSADPRLEEFAQSYLTSQGIVSLLSVPIRMSGNLVGFICHECAIPARQWQLGEMNFAASIGDYAALALESRDRLKAKAALQLAKDQLQAVLDAVPGCISWFSSELKYLGVNGYLAKTFNRSPDDFIGQKIGFLSGSPEFNNLVPDFFNSPEKEARYEIEVVVRGKVQHFLVVAQKYFQGQAAVFVGFDISDRKQIEAELKKVNEELEMRVEQRTKDLRDAIAQLQEENARRERLEELRDVLQFSINRAADSVFWLTPEAELFYVNDAACLSLNYTRDELLSRTLHDINPDITAEVWPDYWEEIKEFNSVRLESRHCTQDGQIFPVEITISYFQVNGKEYNCIFARDISDRKLVESELYQAKAAAETANKARSSFLANMSHELRTPLTAIIGYSELLQEDVEELGFKNKEFSRDLQAINIAGQQLLTVLSEILDFSKIESGQMELELACFDISQLIAEVRAAIEPQIEQDGNTFTVKVPDNIGTMYADLHKVKQVLLSLLGNATKFTENGAISLEVSREYAPDFILLSSGADPTQSGAHKVESWIAFRVSDTGIGMSPQQLQVIFKAFTQLDDSTTRRYGGTGMGLALCRSLCQMMGGEIVVESELNQGSTFIVYLPAYVKYDEEAIDMMKLSSDESFSEEEYWNDLAADDEEG